MAGESRNGGAHAGSRQMKQHDPHRGQVVAQRYRRDAAAIIGDRHGRQDIAEGKATAIADEATDQFGRAAAKGDVRLDAAGGEQACEIVARVWKIEKDEGIFGQVAQPNRLFAGKGMICLLYTSPSPRD